MGSTPRHRPVRVGHLLTSLWPGGIEQFVLSLATGLPKDGFQTRIYSWMGDDPWAEEFRSRKIPVFATRGPNRFRSPLDAFRLTKAWLQLAAQLKRDRIDILHTHDFFPALVGRTASRMAGVPARVTTLHNLYEWWPKWAFAANRLLAGQTTAITCVSESVRQFMIQHEGLSPERYTTILNGVDEDRFRPNMDARAEIRRELDIKDGEILIGSVGSITTRKAQWILAKAVAPLIASGIPVQVRIWGANGSNPQHAEQELMALVGQLGIGDRFRLLPPRRDIERVYTAMDIHCMTSIAEGLSLASVEAMMCGVVPVYSDIGPFREVVDANTGFLFKSEDPADLERTLRVALSRESLAGIALAARSAAVVRFGQTRMVAEYAKIYASCAK
jgi:glycosyltransferase involved in cell wall biosynthesis